MWDVRGKTFHLWNAWKGIKPLIILPLSVAGQGWIPLVGDWNGDLIDTIEPYDPATSVFHIRNSNGSDAEEMAVRYGEPGKGWIPIAGDWDGRRGWLSGFV